MIVNILILLGLVKLLDVTESPLTCVMIYVPVIFILGLLFGGDFTELIFSVIIGGAFAYLYFWLLQKYRDTGILWWMILIIGALIGFL